MARFSSPRAVYIICEARSMYLCTPQCARAGSAGRHAPWTFAARILAHLAQQVSRSPGDAKQRHDEHVSASGCPYRQIHSTLVVSVLGPFFERSAPTARGESPGTGMMKCGHHTDYKMVGEIRMQVRDDQSLIRTYSCCNPFLAVSPSCLHSQTAGTSANGIINQENLSLRTYPPDQWL